MTVLCDTNIISELARPHPNPGVLSWSEGATIIALSVVSLEEIAYGLAAKPNPRIQDWFDTFLQTNCQIIPVTAKVAKCAGDLRGYLQDTWSDPHPSRHADRGNSSNSSTDFSNTQRP